MILFLAAVIVLVQLIFAVPVRAASSTFEMPCGKLVEASYTYLPPGWEAELDMGFFNKSIFHDAINFEVGSGQVWFWFPDNKIYTLDEFSASYSQLSPVYPSRPETWEILNVGETTLGVYPAYRLQARYTAPRHLMGAFHGGRYAYSESYLVFFSGWQREVNCTVNIGISITMSFPFYVHDIAWNDQYDEELMAMALQVQQEALGIIQGLHINITGTATEPQETPGAVTPSEDGQTAVGETRPPVPPGEDDGSGIGVVGVMAVIGVVAAAIAVVLGKVFAGGAAVGKVAADSAAASTVLNASDALGGVQSSIPPVITGGMGVPLLQGGPWDNPHTAFEGGEGPGDCSRQGLPNFWVNTAILNLAVQDTVYGWGGLGPPVDLTLSYNSGSAANIGMFGMGWSFTYDWLLTQSDSVVMVSKGSGQRKNFTMPDGAEEAALPVELSPPAGCYHRLLYYRDYWLYIEKGSHLIHRFDQVPGTQQARLTRVFDYHNNILQIGFDERGHIGSVTDAAGRAVIFKYNDAGLCTTFSLPDGRAASFEYDSAGNLSRAVDLLGVTSDYQYDAESCLTQMVVGRARRTTSFSYRGTGGGKVLETVTNANGNTTRYEMFSMEPRQVKVIDPGERVTVYHGNNSGMTEAVVDPSGSCIRYKYKDALPVSLRNKSGHIIFWEYDQRGNIVKAINPLGSSTSFEYDQYDRLIQMMDTINGVWCYKYDQKHNLVELILPGGEKTISEVNDAGQISATTDFAGRRRLFTYDRYGSLETVTNPDQSIFRFKYDEHGYNLMAVTDPRGNTTNYTYDENGRLLTVTHPDSSVHSDAYDCCAGVSSTDENGHERVFARDALSSILACYDGEGNSISFEYDNCSNLVAVIDPRDYVYRWGYDTAGQLTQLTDPLGGVVGMTRDVEGNLSALRDVRGNETHFEYNENNRMVRWVDSLGRDVKYTYDAMGRTAALINARGNRIAFSYNTNGLIIKKSCDNHPAVELEYDNGGNMVSMTDTVGKTFYSYDAGNPVTAIRYPNGTVISMDYDEVGNLTRITYPGGLQVCYTYDNRNRIIRVDWGESFISYHRDGVGNILAEARSNCVNSHYHYNANNQVVSIRHGNKEEAYVQLSYTRDKAGNITHEEGIYPLKPQMMVKDMTVTYNKLNQVDTCGGESYNYDEDGNLIKIGTDRWEACYDAENRLTELTCENKSFRF
ncbi:MAG: DUF6531 domain-containing protein, partial [Candidatus Contubernalis sp.]|nr:DUF6531 domain-containing protein [Candidatus Contubernalis sp.]